MGIGANNISPKVNYKPSKIDNLLTEKCHLSIEIGRNHFTYTLFDTLNLTYILLKDFEFEAKDTEESTKKIKEIIVKEVLLEKTFYSKSLTFSNFPSTLIPAPFYKEEDKKKVLEFNHEIYEQILTDQLQQMEAINIYSIPPTLLKLVQEKFPDTQMKCGSTIIIEQLLLQNESKEKIFMSVKNWMIEIYVFEDKKLLFHNCFEHETKEDVLYYVLFTMEQLGLSAENTELILLDDILISDETYQLLYDYVRNISFGSRPNNLKYVELLDELKAHQYFGLFRQLLCA